MAIQKKLKNPSAVYIRKSSQETTQTENPKRSRVSREVYSDFPQSLQRLKGLIQSTMKELDSQSSHKSRSFDMALEFIDSLIERTGKEMIDGQKQKGSIRNSPQKILTLREQQVLKLIANGLANKNIATKLKISIRTVEGHRSNLSRKLGIKTTAGLVKYAISRSLT